MTIRKQELDRALHELSVLDGAQVQRISQSTPRELCWQLRRPGETLCLTFSIEPSQEYLCLLPKRPPALPTPPSFCMALRKHLLNSRIVSFESFENDRVAAIKLRRGEESYLFLVELIPHQGRWLLCDDEKTILQLSPPDGGARALRPGVPYEAHAHSLPHTQPTEIIETLGNTDDKADWSVRFPTHTALHQKYVIDAEEQRLHRTRKLAIRQNTARLKKSKRLLQNLERDWQRCESTLQKERDAELLKHNMHQFKRGDTEVVVTDYYEEGMPERAITLDPTLSPQQNLEKLFHRIKRARRGIEVIAQRMERVEETIQELQDRVELLQQAETMDELLPFVQAPRERTQTSKQSREKRSSYREYRSLDGKSIWVGRGSRDNDELTLRVAKGNDLWLHVRGWAGSHVVVPLQRNESPPKETLLDAATLAAHFSKAREHTHIDVMFTYAKYVRKPKGSPPGQVSVTQDKNIALRMEPQRLQRLLQTTEEKEKTNWKQK